MATCPLWKHFWGGMRVLNFLQRIDELKSALG
jgi:hypothetical protein